MVTLSIHYLLATHAHTSAGCFFNLLHTAIDTPTCNTQEASASVVCSAHRDANTDPLAAILLCRRLCPTDKQGKRHFAPVMLGRLQRLGIDKTNPDDLTPEEVRRLHTGIKPVAA